MKPAFGVKICLKRKLEGAFSIPVNIIVKIMYPPKSNATIYKDTPLRIITALL
jgi:hypothetical protein